MKRILLLILVIGALLMSACNLDIQITKRGTEEAVTEEPATEEAVTEEEIVPETPTEETLYEEPAVSEAPMEEDQPFREEDLEIPEEES